MNEDIPAKAYIEAQIIHRASKSGLLAPAVSFVEKEYELEPGTLGSGIFIDSRIISLLYSLILIPKEIWQLDDKNEIYSQIANTWSLSEVVIKTDNSKWENPTYKFIHHLRNSLAHANFQFIDQEFEFWDQYKTDPERFRARLSLNQLENFLELVGALLANLKNAKSI